jgi:hypothetical protein
MSDKVQKQVSEDEPEQHAESKSEDERTLEEEWSQGGQDVEEEQHDEPSSAQTD